MRIAVVAIIAAASAAPALVTAQVQSPTPEQRGAAEGRTDGRLRGLDEGSDLGHAQALVDAWLGGYRRGLDDPSRRRDDATWEARDAWEDGAAAGESAGRAAGLDEGHARGREACAAAFARLQGRPSFMTEAPPPRQPPGPPDHDACHPPSAHRVRLPRGRSLDVRPADAENGRSPLGFDVPRPRRPDGSELRRRARDAGYEDDAMLAWVRGYEDGFAEEWDRAFRNQREATPSSQLRDAAREGEAEGRREASRRRACEDFRRAFVAGWRTSFDEAFTHAFGEGWSAAERLHLDHPVLRIEGASLRDESDDAIIEPGERVTLEVTVANAGMASAPRGSLEYEGTRTVLAKGALDREVRAQSRVTESIALGSADGAPLGAGMVVELRGANGDARRLEATVGRPVVVDGASAGLDVRDGRVVAAVRPVVRNVSRRAIDRGLTLSAGDDAARSRVGALGAGETREPELVVSGAPSWLADGATGEVALGAEDATWMRATWTAPAPMTASVLLAARLPPGSDERDEALTALSRRLMAEYGRALDEPKLYRRLDDASDLSALSRALLQLPPGDRAELTQRLARPLIAEAERKGAPHRVRKAVREALGRR